MARRYRSFTHAADAVMWLSAAIRRRPYRGHGCNLAYRRSLFFDSRGFSSALNLRDGDDDIFINRVTTRDNTAAVVSRDAQVTYSHPSSRHEYRQRRPRRFHTARSLRKGSARFFGFSSLMTWLFVLLTVTAAAAAVYNRDWTQCGAVGAQIALLWLPICLTWRRTPALAARTSGHAHSAVDDASATVHKPAPQMSRATAPQRNITPGVEPSGPPESYCS